MHCFEILWITIEHTGAEMQRSGLREKERIQKWKVSIKDECHENCIIFRHHFTNERIVLRGQTYREEGEHWK